MSGTIRRAPDCTDADLGRRCSDQQWTEIDEGLSEGRTMAGNTVRKLNGLHNLMQRTDPRTLSSEQKRTVALFRAHFKTDSPSDALQISENYGYIQSAINDLSRNSFRCVTQDCCQDQAESRETAAFVMGREPVVYVCPNFFPGPAVTRTTGRSQITTTGLILSPQIKGRIIIHEAAHYRLGVRHSGGEFGYDVVNCDAGHGVRSHRQAGNNAYVYDHFAYCIS